MTNTMEKKYIPLATYFASASKSSMRLTFSEIEQIIGQQLPNAAYLNQSWWKKNKLPAKHFRAWTDAGYIVSEVETNNYVLFQKAGATDSEVAHEEDSNHDILLIRQAEHGDARSLIILQKAVESQSPYMLYDADERVQSTQQARKTIIGWKKEDHSTILMANMNGEHIGYLFVIGNPQNRAAHRASIVIGLHQKAHGKGIGKQLMEQAEEWAQERGISRLELTVVAENHPAIKLFEKMGFVKEGIRRRALMIDGVSHDEIYMAKLF